MYGPTAAAPAAEAASQCDWTRLQTCGVRKIHLFISLPATQDARAKCIAWPAADTREHTPTKSTTYGKSECSPEAGNGVGSGRCCCCRMSHFKLVARPFAHQGRIVSPCSSMVLALLLSHSVEWKFSVMWRGAA